MAFADPNSIPRYAEPTWQELAESEYVETPTGNCWNCGHCIDVCLHGVWHDVCLAERDQGRDNPQAYVVEHSEVTECVDWVQA